MGKIDDSNYEQWLLRYADQELTADECKAVEQWLEGHPEAAEELALYNEAPRLEKNTGVIYEAEVPHRSLPLWPVVLHWTAAAAVVAALVVPVVRMTTDDAQRLAPSVVAAVHEDITPDVVDDTEVAQPQVMPAKQYVSPSTTVTEELVLLADEMPVEQMDTIAEEYMIEEITAPAVEYCDNLIAYESAPDTVYTNNLIAYDNSRRSWTEDVKDWATDTKVAQWVRRRIKAHEFELLANNTEY